MATELARLPATHSSQSPSSADEKLPVKAFRTFRAKNVIEAPRERSRQTVAANVNLKWRFSDFYYFLVTISWPAFVSLVTGVYLTMNLIFAGLYYAGADGTVVNASTYGDFLAFSIQTWCTVGYGYMYPNNAWAHSWVTTEVICSLMLTATLTGLVYARFARPVALINFSDSILISSFNGRRVMQFRIANGRSQNRLVDATIKVVMARDETTAEGIVFRRLYDLPLIRDHQPLFTLMWLVFHDVDDKSSPLHDCKPEVLEANPKFFRYIIVTVTGYDAELAQTVYHTHLYFPSKLRFDVQFEDMIIVGQDGSLVVDHGLINSVRTSLSPLRHPNEGYRVDTPHNHEEAILQSAADASPAQARDPPSPFVKKVSYTDVGFESESV